VGALGAGGPSRRTLSSRVGATNASVIRWGLERARTGPWRGDRRIAYLAPVPDAPVPSADFVRRCLDQLAAKGFSRVVTGALSPIEQDGFLGAGFEVEERLHLLGRDLDDIPQPDRPAMAPYTMRRAGQRDRPAVLVLDNLAFPPFWRLDRDGLAEAISATPSARFRVVAGPDGCPGDGTLGRVGYAVTGRAGRRGFLQRLAVHPARQGEGLGRWLVLDSLRWLRRRQIERVVVNTQLGNARALALYESLGFRREPAGLSVLSVGLPPY